MSDPVQPRLRTIVVDDEAHARERLRRLLAQDAGVELVRECSSGSEAVAAVGELRPDLMLLDVHMPELDGFGVIKAIPPEILPLVVFVTAHDAHAVQAFDVHALDYVLKPVEAPRLFAAIARTRTQLQRQSPVRTGEHYVPAAEGAEPGDVLPAPEGSATPTLDRMLIRHDGQMYPVRAREIVYVEAEGNYVRLHLPDRNFLVRETMANMERRLQSEQFARIHRSTIVNLDAVREMQPWFGGDYVVILKTGGRLKASRFYRSRLQRWIVG